MTPQLQAALLRAGGLGLVVFAGSFGVAMATGQPWQTALGVGLAAVATAFGWRTGEGLRDTYRDVHGIVKQSDVGQRKRRL